MEDALAAAGALADAARTHADVRTALRLHQALSALANRCSMESSSAFTGRGSSDRDSGGGSSVLSAALPHPLSTARERLQALVRAWVCTCPSLPCGAAAAPSHPAARPAVLPACLVHSTPWAQSPVGEQQLAGAAAGEPSGPLVQAATHQMLCDAASLALVVLSRWAWRGRACEGGMLRRARNARLVGALQGGGGQPVDAHAAVCMSKGRMCARASRAGALAAWARGRRGTLGQACSCTSRRPLPLRRSALRTLEVRHVRGVPWDHGLPDGVCSARAGWHAWVCACGVLQAPLLPGWAGQCVGHACVPGCV